MSKTKTFITMASLTDVKKADSSKGILVALEAVMKTQATVNRKVQIIAASLANHLYTHGDIRPIRKMLEMLSEHRPHDVFSMSAYLDKFAPVRFDEKGEIHFDKSATFSIEGLLTEKWWTVAKPQVYKPFVFADEQQKLIARAEKRQANPQGDEDNFDGLAEAKESLRRKDEGTALAA